MRIDNMHFMCALIFYLCVTYCISEAKSGTKAQQFLETERQKLKESNKKCQFNKLDIQALDSLRIKQKYRAAQACYIEYLSTNHDSHWAWSGLGDIYQALNNQKESSTCFKIANKIIGAVSSFPRGWHFLGPFGIGKLEVDGDPVESFGGINNVSQTRFDRSFRLYSELSLDGEIGWTSIATTGKNKYLQVNFGGIDWGDLVNSLGSMGITEWQGWLVGEFSINGEVKDKSIAIRCLGVHTVFVDGKPITGDLYRRDQFQFPVESTKGIHQVLIHARSKGSLNFYCDIEQTTKHFQIHPPTFLPDLYDGKLFSGYFYIVISNLLSDRPLKHIHISIKNYSPTSTELQVIVLDKLAIVAPGQVKPILCQLSAGTDIVSPIGEDLKLTLEISMSEGKSEIDLTLKNRKVDESFIFTFIDHDGSVQHAAAIRPWADCKLDGCPVVLTLHGTTVPARNQADSYKRMVDGRFVFGLETSWIVAPTRHGAHNWEGPGALTALSALKQLSDLTWVHEWLKVKASRHEVIFAGHSMGGHGAWHLSTHFPDLAVAVVTMAGWIKKEEYGDSNLFFRHDIATSHAEPAVKAVLEKCVSENDADRFASNLKGTPVMIRIGRNDRTVHPYFTRRMYRILKECSVDVEYTELAGKEHWWWDTWETNDGGCVNDEQLRNFMNSRASAVLPTQPKNSADSAACDSADNSDCSADSLKSSMYSQVTDESFTFTVFNPAFSGSMRGISVIVQLVPMQQSVIKVSIVSGEILMGTVNVMIMRLQIARLRPIYWKHYRLKIDGQTVHLQESTSDKCCLCLQSGTWSICDMCSSPEDNGLRGPNTIGPARRVAEERFIIVTGASIEYKRKELMSLAVYIANQFFLTSDTPALVLEDSQLTDELADEHNLIIIGNPDENSFTQRFLDKTLLKFINGSIQLKSCVLESKRSGILTLAPHGNTHLALLLMGSDTEGLKDVVSLAAPTIPPMARSPFSNMVPDFILTNQHFGARGQGGYSCTGFWDSKWGIRPELISCPYCAL